MAAVSTLKTTLQRRARSHQRPPGVTAEIFRLQSRGFIASLAPHFRLVFADGPFLSEMHEDLKVVYGSMGPCRRWARWVEHHPPIDNDFCVEQMEQSLETAMDADAGTGEWVGVLGFSQGAKLAFSILLENQMAEQADPSTRGFAGARWKFGIIMAARAPPYTLSARTKGNQYFLPPGEVPREEDYDTSSNPHLLQKPTLHVHGLQDPSLELHRTMLQDYCDPSFAELIEWNAGHRLAFRSEDIKKITDGILRAAKVSHA